MKKSTKLNRFFETKTLARRIYSYPQTGGECSYTRRTKAVGMRRTCLYAAMTTGERNAGDERSPTVCTQKNEIMKINDITYVCVFRTYQLADHSLVARSLQEKGIPLYKEQTTADGWPSELPKHPDMREGTTYALLVPEDRAAEARAVVNEAPVAPGANLTKPLLSPRAKLLIKGFVAVNAIVAGLLLIYVIGKFY